MPESTGFLLLKYGTLLVRLTSALWDSGSRQGRGFQIVGTRLLRITDPDSPFEVQVIQHDRSNGSTGDAIERGGVGYQILIGH